MAIRDVASDYTNQVTNGATLSIQPASGDEWLITSIFTEEGAWTIAPESDTASQEVGAYGTDVAGVGSDNDFEDMGTHIMTFLATNATYPVITNGSGGTINGGFSSIKTKE
jgi:hypothetical protein